jgi:tripartite-type tricarboxylate transporter receptor subunit TctC
MKKSLNRWLWLLLLLAGGATAQTQKWPAKPIRLYVGFATGSSTDVVARVVADGLSPKLGQQVVVDNRAGGSGIIAANAVAKAAPDGYTMLLTTPTPISTASHVFLNLPYDPFKDFAPVALIGNTYYILAVSNQTGAKSVKDLVALAKARPGQLNYSSVGEGSLSHLGAVIFSDMAGIQAVHVPYKGSAQSVLDVVGGRIDFLFTAIATTQTLHKDGKLRIVAVAGPKQAILPDVPPIAESGYPDCKLYFWFGTFMPAATPADIVTRMNRESNAVVNDPRVGKLLFDAGVSPETSTPQGMAAIAREYGDVFNRAILKAGIKPQPL